jgi:SAM-dependent methyltransferase
MPKLANNPPFEWDEQWYIQRYTDVADAIVSGRMTDPLRHYLEWGQQEGRYPSKLAEERDLSCRECGDRQLDIITLLDWPVRGETQKTFRQRLVGGFFQKYMLGSVILDIGYKGGNNEAVPVLPHAIGVDIDYPGYDGVTLPFPDESVDCLFSSHVLEHVNDSLKTVRDWFRVIKIGGYIVCIVPHQYLYERKTSMPSRWSSEHLRFYTPSSLLQDFESALEPNSYRVRHLADNDHAYRYDLGLEHHPSGSYEIELVVEKISPPEWRIA